MRWPGLDVGCLVVAFAMALAPLGVAQAPGGERAFVEVQASAATVWLQQPCDLVVRIGFDAEWFATAAIPLFQQRLDQPFQLVVPWLFGAEDRAVTPLPAPPGTATQRIAVGDQVLAAARAGVRDVDGRRFELLELRYRWLPLAAGTSTVAPVELRYAFATRFDADFLRGRQPLDRQEQSVLSAPLPLQVRALPVAGRPAGFTGAVGEFAVRASTTATAVAVGAVFDVELLLTGDGNLDRIAPVPAPDLPGFHVQGMRELRREPGRTFVFSLLALRAGATEVPALAFAAFSPRAGDYVVHHTAALPLHVEPLPAGGKLAPAVAALVRADAQALRAANAWPWWSYALAAVGATGVLTMRAVVRRRRRRQRDLAAALAQLASALVEGPAAAALAFERLCARCAETDLFHGETVWPALRAAGGDEATVTAAQQAHAALDAARFGGVPPPAASVTEAARALVAQTMRGEGFEPSRPLPACGF